MKKSFIFSLIIILFFSSLLSADNVSTLDVGNSNPEVEFVPGELLVKYKTPFRAATSSFYKNNWNISTIRTFKSIGCQQVKLPQGMTVEQAMDMYQNDPNVEYAEPNYIYHATLTPNDPSFVVTNDLWGLNNFGQNVNGTGGTPGADIDAIDAWDTTTGSTNVIIAVIDSGVKYDHEDLVDNIWSNTDEAVDGGDTDGNGYMDDIRGWDFVDNDNDPMDYNGHGTHVAGTIAAVGNNGTGVTGVCWTAKIMPIRGLDAAGSGNTADLIQAIQYANANGAHVINNSWGGGGYSQALKNAIDASSAVVVCAAGNSYGDNDATPHYPSSYTSTNIISVAATDQNDLKPDFSNWGATSVDVGAPGTNIYSTVIARHDVQLIDDFSGGLGNWTTDGGATDNWGIEGGYLTESPGGPYANNTNSWIRTTGSVNLVGEVGYRLEFRLRGISESYFDILYIDTSSNGSTWTNIDALSGSTGINWFPMEYDISTYAGGNFYIRFRFTSNGSVNFDGWRIDDVKVTAYTPGTHNSYDYKDGTSMAAPIVSGIAGLIKATTPAITNTQIKAAIEQNVDTIPSLSGDVATGGRVNANNIFPAAPSTLVATAFSGSQINLTWTDNSSNEDGFIIERKTGAGGTWSEIDTASANTTTYSNTGLNELTPYYYRVYAYHTGVNSPYSNEANATTPLGAPSSLDASTFSSTEIALTWSDNSTIETGFRIERKLGVGGIYAEIATVGANVTTYRNDSGLSALTEYYYRIRAYNGGVNSNYSNEDNATTLDPNAPSGLTAAAVSANQIDLVWDDNSANEDGFRIERKIGVGGTYAQIGTVELDVETYSDTGLSALAECFYRVFSYDAGGADLAQSNEASATTHGPPSDSGGGGGGGGGSCFISTAASGL